ncbi:PREDICTED: galactosylgalactosylxylosylprotein 3-beta-glucuronosyltransferase 2 [Nipponia nippon]|uniref:galactosylgalactosylxylosylprotein 3-beta-glucuronosyltransferase 2 n=1 Tax=Nipponia nippon TaxID=128390 RepID=UPI0005107EAF|nr:PREDICTED: galactosylgalactosylxylosylprotein 3-beta-glucuronosyltransferase 2 [Nipponia nippon]
MGKILKDKNKDKNKNKDSHITTFRKEGVGLCTENLAREQYHRKGPITAHTLIFKAIRFVPHSNSSCKLFVLLAICFRTQSKCAVPDKLEGSRDILLEQRREEILGRYLYPPEGINGATKKFVGIGVRPAMRTTRKVSVWPVGLVGGRRYERPVVENGKVVGWYTGWRADRPFAIDMAGFAVSLQVILSHPKAVFKRRGSQPGMQESDFLKQITTVEELEPKANNCTKVLVWHTRTEKVNLANEPKYHLDTVNIEV